ncbi:hypothetical protein V5799_027255 [Amblyomma americanum]|uniref:Uncharacterized protein n=1 Tax=Amblyomma americanum TaxID=6943 RepID=A0AAQ4DG87_AMBAM
MTPDFRFAPMQGLQCTIPPAMASRQAASKMTLAIIDCATAIFHTQHGLLVSAQLRHCHVATASELTGQLKMPM